MDRPWIIYARVSTKGQEEKYGLDVQLRILPEYAKRMEWKYETLNEGAVSGETIFERPKMVELLNKIKTGDYEGVLVIELDRLSRSKHLGEWDVIKEAFVSGKSKIATPSKILDPSSSDDDFILDIGGVLSKREKKQILVRMTRGKAQKLSSGKSIGGTTLPFGYRANLQGGEIEIDPDEKEIFDLCVEWGLEGYSCYYMEAQLNAMGLPTRYGSKGWKMNGKPVSNLWRASMIYKILTSEIYTGLKPQVFRFRSYHKENVNLFLPALVTPEKYAILQSKLRGVRKDHFRRRENIFFYLFKDILYCEKCGRKMYGTSSPKKRKDDSLYTFRQYVCHNHFPPPRGKNCSMKNIPAEYLEETVWNEIVSLMENPEGLARLLKEADESALYSEPELESKLEYFEKLSKEQAKEEERLLSAYRKGIIGIDELESQKKAMEKESQEMQKKISGIQNSLSQVKLEKSRVKSQ